MVLAGGEAIQPEVVIAATGYRHGLEPLVGHLGVLLESGKPAERTGGAHPAAPGLYFNGYWLPLRPASRDATHLSPDRARDRAKKKKKKKKKKLGNATKKKRPTIGREKDHARQAPIRARSSR